MSKPAITIHSTSISSTDTGSAPAVDVELTHPILGRHTITVIEYTGAAGPQWDAYYGDAGPEYACGLSWRQLEEIVRDRCHGIDEDALEDVTREHYEDIASAVESAAASFAQESDGN